MKLRPVKPGLSSDDSVPALISPREGRTDDEVVQWLRRHGAKDVEVLAPGFISARASSATLEDAKAIAHVEKKRRKQLRY